VQLKLMQQVCAAVTIAHQKGVVHRDLKPGNVLVAEERGKVQIKIIDFGLAMNDVRRHRRRNGARVASEWRDEAPQRAVGRSDRGR
jgi:serine/threonine protein kinase